MNLFTNILFRNTTKFISNNIIQQKPLFTYTNYFKKFILGIFGSTLFITQHFYCKD